MTRGRRLAPAVARLALAAVCLAPLRPALVRPAAGQEVPYLSGRVVDLADLIDPGTESRIDASLAAFEEETGTQIAVLTVSDLEGGSIEDFSIRVAEAWELGREEFDDGVLLVIARDDRRMRIEVGYGLEGALTDAESRRILDRVLTPAFRRGDFGRGIEDGLTVVMAEVRGETPPPEILEGDPDGMGSEGAVIALVQLLFFLFVIWMMIRSSRRRRGAWSSRGGWGPVHPDWSGGGRSGRPPIVLLPPIGRRRRGGDGGGGRGGLGGGGFGGFGGSGGGFGGGGASGGW